MTVTTFPESEQLSKWVFIGKEGTFSEMLGGDKNYIMRVRKSHRPVVYIVIRPRGKYKFSVAIDLVEGLDVYCHRYEFTEYGNQRLTAIMTSKPYYKLTSIFAENKSFVSARYTSILDAVAVANQLAGLAEEKGVWEQYLS